METSLHQQLKALYSGEAGGQEVGVEGFRIDAIDGGRLIEIQYASLGALRGKLQRLLEGYDVLVVKPLAARKRLISRRRKKGKIESSRYSPKRETFYHVFLDMVHFVDVFPHPRLTLEVVLTEQEEHRLPRRSGRWSRKTYRVEDRTLKRVCDRLQLRTTDDLLAMLPEALPDPFSTAQLAALANIPRWLAQKMAYCLRRTRGVTIAGKCGNSLLYHVDPTNCTGIVSSISRC